MKTRQTIIAAAVAALLVSSTAFAKELHEDKWNHVKSYGNVLLTDDSVENWGPWSDFVEPAAGAPSPVQMPGSGGSDPYKKTPDVLTQGCAAGDWCGYAIFRDKSSESGGDYPGVYAREGMKYRTPMNAGLFSLSFVADPSITAGSGQGEGTVFWRLTSLDTLVVPNFTDSGTPIPVYFGGRRDDGLHHFRTVEPEYEAFMLSGTTDTSSASGFSHSRYSHEAEWGLGGRGPFEMAISARYYDADNGWTKNDEVAIGKFMRQVETYTSGEEVRYDEGGSYSATSTNGYYVVGIATPQSYLAGQQTQNINAIYRGGSFDGSRQGCVQINVQFGTATWNGYWSSMGKGTFGFEASGTINGSNITSTAFGEQKGATLSGYVQGTFYGQTAGSIGGVSSVTRTTTIPTPSMDSRIAMPTQPMTQTQTALFLVNKSVSYNNTPK